METEIPDSLEPIRNRAINRPKYRGVLHSYCFFISIPAGILLVASAPTAAAKFESFAFALVFRRCWASAHYFTELISVTLGG